MNVYEMVTSRIISKLNEGIIPWQRGWTGTIDGAYNFKTKRRYSLLNQMLLEHQDGYLTFKQIGEMGERVIKGAKSEFVVFWKIMQKDDPNKKDAEGKPEKVTIPILRYYNVFWIGDTTLFMYKVTWEVKGKETFPTEDEMFEEEDVAVAKSEFFKTREEADEFALKLKDDPLVSDIQISEPRYDGHEAKLTEHNPITEAEDIIGEYVTREDGLTFQNDRPSNQAYYAPLLDTVVVPMISQFTNAEEYYSTAFHELTHSTGAKHRLNRLAEGKAAAFGNLEYSKEELVAELGAAMLVNHCGIETEKSFRNSAGYVQGWLKALNNDQRLIVSAASKAEKAVNYILGGNGNE